MNTSHRRTPRYSALAVLLWTMSQDDQMVVSMWAALEGNPEARKNLFQDARFMAPFNLRGSSPTKARLFFSLHRRPSWRGRRWPEGFLRRSARFL